METSPLTKPDDLDDGVRKYLEFHLREPSSVDQLNVALPASVKRAGQATHTAYRSKKWDGVPHDYWHDHEGGVAVYVPGQGTSVPGWIRNTKTLVRLGSCLEVAFDDPAGGKPFRVPGSGGAGLYCTPDGHALVVASRSNVLAILWGGYLGITKRGIVG